MGELQVRSVGLSGGMPVIETDDPIPGLEVESVYIPGPRGLQYGGQYRGLWDMSSGTVGPAAPATDYQAAHTGTTITPDAHLTSGQPFPFSGAASALIPILTSGIAQASLIVPSTSPGDTVYETMLLLTNSATTSAIFEQLINSSITPGMWLVGVSFSSIPGYVQLFVYNDGASSVGATVSVTAGDVLLLQYDHATGVMTLSVNGTPAGTSTLDVGAIPSGQGLHLMSGVLSNSADVVFAAGSITVNFSDTSGGGTGFSVGHDADLPVGALDNDWYKVSAGGYYKGNKTRANQYVKLINGKTDLIIVDTPADSGTSSLEAVTVTHFSDINTTGLAEPRLYVVTADETNANQRTQYLYDGAALMWLVALEA